MKSKVAFVKVERDSNSVQNAVKKAMRLAKWKQHIKGKKIFVKINGMSDQLVPGQCSSPWVIDAVLSELRKEFPKSDIKMGDSDLGTHQQLNKAAKVWGFYDIADKFDVEFVNLSEQDLVKKDFNGQILREIEVPKLLLDADSIINIPVAKTHCLTTITCCLKNHWGMLPKFRHQFHLVVNQAIPDVNVFFRKTTFNIVDATIGMEGNGPRTGIPKIFDAIFAGCDRVAVDSAVATFMRFNPRKIEHIVNAEKIGVGRTDFEIVGDVSTFKPVMTVAPRMNTHPVFLLERSCRKTPVLNTLIFRTKIFDFFAWCATQYNTTWWYNLYGKKYTEEIISNSCYGDEFRRLYERAGSE